LALELSPADSHVVLATAFTLASLGFADEGSKLADRAFRLDPHMPPALLSGLKDTYYMARRYEDVIATVDRAPEEERLRDMWLMFAVSHARLGHEKEARDAVAKLLHAHPNISAERMLNEDYGTFAREEDKAYFVDGFRILKLPMCMTSVEIAQFEDPKPVPGCEAERASAAAEL
jgi:tetratricopeptide (TPR) repeat protein